MGRIISREDLKNLDDKYPGWPTEHDDFFRTTCYPNIKPSIKPELTNILIVWHHGPCEEAEQVFCTCEMKDRTLVQHDSHLLVNAHFVTMKIKGDSYAHPHHPLKGPSPQSGRLLSSNQRGIEDFVSSGF